MQGRSDWFVSLVCWDPRARVKYGRSDPSYCLIPINPPTVSSGCTEESMPHIFHPCNCFFWNSFRCFATVAGWSWHRVVGGFRAPTPPNPWHRIICLTNFVNDKWIGIGNFLFLSCGFKCMVDGKKPGKIRNRTGYFCGPPVVFLPVSQTLVLIVCSKKCIQIFGNVRNLKESQSTTSHVMSILQFIKLISASVATLGENSKTIIHRYKC